MPERWDITPHISEIERMRKRGDSLRMIAKALGTNHRTLSKYMQLHGIAVPTREESAKRTWKNHKHPFLGKRGPESHNYGRKLSEERKARLIAAISGPNNYHWSGGRKKHALGYVLVYAPEHPSRSKEGYVLEHRLVMEQSIGRYLSPDEIVHHINGDKQDNRLCNLELTNRAEHARHHMNEMIGGTKRAQQHRCNGKNC